MDAGFLDTYTVMGTQIQRASTEMAPGWGRMTSNATGGGWENYGRAGEYMHIKNLLLE
jgi:hypothetical protein